MERPCRNSRSLRRNESDFPETHPEPLPYQIPLIAPPSKQVLFSSDASPFSYPVIPDPFPCFSVAYMIFCCKSCRTFIFRITSSASVRKCADFYCHHCLQAWKAFESLFFRTERSIRLLRIPMVVVCRKRILPEQKCPVLHRSLTESMPGGFFSYKPAYNTHLWLPLQKRRFITFQVPLRYSRPHLFPVSRSHPSAPDPLFSFPE